MKTGYTPPGPPSRVGWAFFGKAWSDRSRLELASTEILTTVETRQNNKPGRTGFGPNAGWVLPGDQKGTLNLAADGIRERL